MKTLTLKQPMASLAAAGCINFIEMGVATRYRGRILIHSGKEYATPPESVLNTIKDREDAVAIMNATDIPTGCIIGSVEITECTGNDGKWLWHIDTARRFETPKENINGRPGLWNYNEEILEEVIGECAAPGKQLHTTSTEKRTEVMVSRPLNNTSPDLNPLSSLQTFAEEETSRLPSRDKFIITYIPAVIYNVAWHYAELALKHAASHRLSEYREWSKGLKDLKRKYEDNLCNEFTSEQLAVLKQSTADYLSNFSHDHAMLHYSISNELLRTMPDQTYQDMRIAAITSIIYLDLLIASNIEINFFLSKILNLKKELQLTENPLNKLLRKGMEAYAATSSSFNYTQNNIMLSIKILQKKIKDELYKL